MNRKAIIVILVVLNLGTMGAWLASHLAIGDGQEPKTNGLSAWAFQGRVVLQHTSIVTAQPGSGVTAPESWRIGTESFGFGRLVGVETICEQPWRAGETGFVVSWKLAFPLWISVLTIAIPTAIFWYRNRRPPLAVVWFPPSRPFRE